MIICLSEKDLVIITFNRSSVGRFIPNEIKLFKIVTILSVMENQYIITTIFGFFISGVGLYHFRDTIIRNAGWYFFKLQANYHILTKPIKNESN